MIKKIKKKYPFYRQKLKKKKKDIRESCCTVAFYKKIKTRKVTSFFVTTSYQNFPQNNKFKRLCIRDRCKIMSTKQNLRECFVFI
jgi:hypothetical protein